jgi:hypothetical protein
MNIFSKFDFFCQNLNNLQNINKFSNFKLFQNLILLKKKQTSLVAASERKTGSFAQERSVEAF